ncbi:MAG TPA: hypothetical protein VHY79_04805 [Rhizomicrobium sp.]|nr:hypothetical protein [Rhizomicrobium sp.]
MSLKADMHGRSLGADLRSRWNDFAGTAPGDTLATLLTIATMFGAMFCCAFAIDLGSDALQLILRSH